MLEGPDALRLEHVEQVLRQSWLAGAEAEVMADAMTTVRQRILRDGELVFARNDPGDGIYTLASGVVRFSRATLEGRSSMISMLEPVSWFGELSTFDGLPRTHDAHAVGPTLLLHHGEADFRRMLKLYPMLYASFVKLLSKRMRRVYDWIEDATVLPFPARLARRLLALYHGEADHSITRKVPAVPVTQEQLGQLLGRSRQTIAKQLLNWEARGLIRMHYGRVVIADSEGLQRVAQG